MPVERLEPLSRNGLWVVVILVKVKGENGSSISESIIRATWCSPECVVEGLKQTQYTTVTVIQTFRSRNTTVPLLITSPFGGGDQTHAPAVTLHNKDRQVSPALGAGWVPENVLTYFR